MKGLGGSVLLWLFGVIARSLNHEVWREQHVTFSWSDSVYDVYNQSDSVDGDSVYDAKLWLSCDKAWRKQHTAFGQTDFWVQHNVDFVAEYDADIQFRAIFGDELVYVNNVSRNHARYLVKGDEGGSKSRIDCGSSQVGGRSTV